MEFIIREGGREIKYTNDEISRIWVAPTEVSCLNVFCMYMCRVPEGLNHNGKVKLAVPSRCVSDFGKFPVVVLDSVEFINRYKKAAMLGGCKAIGCGPVRYLEIDDRSPHFFSLALSKAPSFNYQQEFRLVFHVNREDDPVSLNMGDIRDITSVGSVEFGDSEVANSTSQIIYYQQVR